MLSTCVCSIVTCCFGWSIGILLTFLCPLLASGRDSIAWVVCLLGFRRIPFMGKPCINKPKLVTSVYGCFDRALSSAFVMMNEYMVWLRVSTMYRYVCI